MYKLTFPAGSINSSGTTTITVGAAHATEWRTTDEQLAAAWDRPLDEIHARVTRPGKSPSEQDMKRFCEWLIAKGMTRQQGAV